MRCYSKMFSVLMNRIHSTDRVYAVLLKERGLL
nr:MAG TPA: hypothetical protein [Crassvirales sp.]